jgi:hypothetical protein
MNNEDEPSTIPPKVKSNKKLQIALVIVSAIAIILAAYILFANPSTSVIASVHDADGDGIPDADDAFPNDSTEWKDTDQDGYGDNSDAFPNLITEHLDSDKDGVGDNADEFPNDPTQRYDSDNDGYGDNQYGNDPDMFPNDPNEWNDNDSDGVGDNSDFYDQGNGKVEIAILSYVSDGSMDLPPGADPYFNIFVDTDGDSTFDFSVTSNTFWDNDTWINPYSVIIDIPDYTSTVSFYIEVWENEPEIARSYPVDYTPTYGTHVITHTLLAPSFEGHWSFDGKDDSRAEWDCELEYSIGVVA